MDCYFTLCHNTYGYSLLFYKVYIRRENAGSWNSGLEKEQILETYSAQLQKSWNSTEHLKINKEKSSPKMKARGPTSHPGSPTGVGWAWQACGLLVAPLWYFFRPVFFIKSKIIPRWFSRLLELRRIGISNLLLFQARIPVTGILPLHVNLAK